MSKIKICQSHRLTSRKRKEGLKSSWVSRCGWQGPQTSSFCALVRVLWEHQGWPGHSPPLPACSSPSLSSPFPLLLDPLKCKLIKPELPPSSKTLRMLNQLSPNPWTDGDSFSASKFPWNCRLGRNKAWQQSTSEGCLVHCNGIFP